MLQSLAIFFTLLVWLPDAGAAAICEVLKSYPRGLAHKLSFEGGKLSEICSAFTKRTRAELDRCGDSATDPYVSQYTWPSRLQLLARGKVNLYTDRELSPVLPDFMKRIDDLRRHAANECCVDDVDCRLGMQAVRVEFCKPQSHDDQPDACVFGGNYRMSAAGYDSSFQAILSRSTTSSKQAAEIKRIARRNLGGRMPSSVQDGGLLPRGSIVLSSYVSKKDGVKALEPVLMHEFGHACSMVRMQNSALNMNDLERATRATEWLDQAKSRCDLAVPPSAAYEDFWIALGETRELAACLQRLATLNQQQVIDRPCKNLCPGHYLEESVGIAFSLLAGEIAGGVESVFPNTCDHTRDAQHPMVADVAECLAENSVKFRARVAKAYGCH